LLSRSPGQAHASLSPGAALVNQEGCLACHSLRGSGGTAASRLEYIGSHRDAGWIADYLENPAAFAQDTGMPAYPHLQKDQRILMGDFIVAAAATSRAR